MLQKKIWFIIPATIIVVALLLAGAFIWGHMQGPEKPPAFLPGVYTCVAQNEFCRIDDTLTIRRTRMGEDNYTVTRTTSFVRIREGRRDSTECQRQHWDGKYQGSFRLVSVNGLDTVWYYPDTNTINKGSFDYEKIE